MRFLTDSDYAHFNHTAVDTLRTLIPYDKVTAKNIVITLFGALAYQSNYVIAGFAGHAHPDVSYQSYIHFTDIIFGILLWHCDYQLTTHRAKNMLAIPRRNLDIIDNRESLNAYIFAKLHCKPLAKLKSKTIITPKKTTNKKFTFDTVKSLLSNYGTDEFERQRQYFDVPMQTFQVWLNNASTLKADDRFFTKFNKSRLYNDNGLVLTKKLSSFESKLNAELITGFRKHFQNPKHQEKLKFFIMYILTHSLQNDATLSFDNIDDLQKFLWAINWLKLNEHTYLTVHHLNAQAKPIQKQWQNSWKKLAKNHVDFKETDQRKRQPSVKLAILEKRDGDKRQILSYFASFVYIMMADKIELTV